MIQTTIGVFKKRIYDQSTPKALLAWHRVRLANWLASSGEEWANYVSQYNSGMHKQKLDYNYYGKHAWYDTYTCTLYMYMCLA